MLAKSLVAVGTGCRCLAHTLWVGSSFMVVTSLGLMAHHLFGCWHGDYRLKRKYGEVRYSSWAERGQPDVARRWGHRVSNCTHR